MKIFKYFKILIFIVCCVCLSFCSNKINKGKIQAEDPGIRSTTDGDFQALILTPNESFFSPVGALRANKFSNTGGSIYNKYERYDYIYDWSILTDTIVFGVNIKTAGNLIIKPEMGISQNQDGSKLWIYLGDTRKELSLVATGSESNYVMQNDVVFENVSPGFYEVKLQLKSLTLPDSSVGRLHNLQLTGTAVKDIQNVMRRYRAKAVHCRWETESNNPVEISVHELTIATMNQDFYQPITTPFGYTGSTWDKDTQTFGGYNFSLWSYGAKDPIPPFYQESHLIAVGPGLKFGAYGHEGTGVKPRGNHPYIGVQTNKQVIAVRKVPGELYDTYWSYYLDPVEEHWKFYGCGKKYNKSGILEGLKTGAFVEVPGPASRVRNGHELCETHYAGWQLDTSGNWHAINKMVGTSGQNDISFRDWKIVNNKFSMQMGGWGEPGIESKTLILNNPDLTPYYLQGPYLDELYFMPAKFSHENPISIGVNSVILSCNIEDLGTNPSAELYYGTEEGLTKKDKWENVKPVNLNNGPNSIILDNLEPKTHYYYRLKIKNDEGITWSFNTESFQTI